MKFLKHFALATVIVALPSLGSAKTVNLAGGKTKVALSSVLLGALQELNVTVEGVGPARLNSKGVAAFPVTTGIADLTNTYVDIEHVGGLSLKAGSTTVKLVNYIIEVLPGFKQPYISGIVTVNGAVAGRLPLFDIVSVGGVSTGDHGLSLENVKLSLDPAAATALNSVFNMSAFKGGLDVGTANSLSFEDDCDEERDDH